MSLRIKAAVPALALAAATAASAQRPEDEAPQDRGAALVNAFLDDVATLSADFEQELWTQEPRLIEVSSGSVSIERPSRFRWEYVEPYEQLIVADGEQLKIYEPDIRQVTVSDIGEMPPSSPAMLLAGDADVRAGFDVGETAETDGLVWVTLLPKVRNPDFEFFRLGFQGADLAQMEIVDGLDQTTIIWFRNMRINPDLDDRIFELRVPAGTDVLDGTG